MSANDPSREPFPDLASAPLTERDRHRLIGRGDKIDLLGRIWTERRLTVLHGQSGSGKTSLVRAGVVPALLARGVDVLPVVSPSLGPAGPAPYPVAGLPPQNPYTRDLLATWAPSEPPTRLAGLSITDQLRRHSRALGTARTGGWSEPKPVLAAIDQTERLFRHPDSPWARPFVAEILRAYRAVPGLRLLLIVRQNRLDEFTRVFKSFELDPSEWLEVDAFGREEVRRSLLRPPADSRPHFTDDAAEELLDTLTTAQGDGAEAGGTIEPAMLQALCRPVWELPPTNAHGITTRALPDVDELLSEMCRAAIGSVSIDHDLAPAEVIALLRDLRRASRHARHAAVLDALEERSLLSSRRRDASLRYEIRHPLLARVIMRLSREHWPRPMPDAAARVQAAWRARARGDLALADSHARAAAGGSATRSRAEAESCLGDLAALRGLVKTAIRHYNTAAELFESTRDSAAAGRHLGAIGRLHLARGEQDLALRALDRAATRTPNDPAVKTAIALALWHVGKPQEAKAVLREVLTGDGDNPEALRLRGEILADSGESESALRDLERVGSDPPASVRAARGLALARAGPDSAEAARRDLEQAAAEADDSGPVLLRVAKGKRAAGDRRAATELASQAVRASRPPLPSHLRNEAERLLEEV
jgi:tetratricopeptide (TPR) repeat protein